MRALVVAAAVTALICSFAPAGFAQNSQQEQMRSCNRDAATKKLTGTERQNYMADCLAGHAAQSPQIKTGGNSRSTTGSAGDRGITPGQHSTEAVAKMSCGSDTVVWVNSESHVYHFKNNRSYGKTKQGAYMCERDARAAGSQAAKNEKRS
jgi:hypothetical protein